MRGVDYSQGPPGAPVMEAFIIIIIITLPWMMEISRGELLWLHGKLFVLFSDSVSFEAIRSGWLLYSSSWTSVFLLLLQQLLQDCFRRVKKKEKRLIVKLE